MTDLLELSVTRYIDAPPQAVYRVWTERTAEWFAPKPFLTHVHAQELKSGGRSVIEIEGPDGTKDPHEGVFLEVVPNERIVTTNLFAAGWEPRTQKATECDFGMVSITTFEPEGSGTRYTARARHFDAEAVKQHQEMGFEQGWGLVADQLAELAEAEAGATRQAA
jgi:uncharacterized protein YndB with AHSA1/START domain